MIIGNLTHAVGSWKRVRPAYVITGGLCVASVGYAIFTLAGSTSGPGAIFVAMCVVMVGTGPLAALCNHLAMGAVPPEKAGSGASIFQTAVELGLGFGIATLATLGTAAYRRDLESTLGAVPPDAASAARESVDRAVAAAGQLPAEQSRVLLAAARDAFTFGMHLVGLVSAAFFVALAMLALWAFRDVRSIQGAGDMGPQEDLEGAPVREAVSATEG